MRAILYLMAFILCSANSFAASSLSPEIRAEGLYYPENLSPETKGPRGLYTLKLPGNLRLDKEWKFQFNPMLMADPQSASKSERYFADPTAAYLQWQSLPFTAQLGWNTFQWGDTDIFNPLDVVNQRRYVDPLRAEKLGAPSLFLRWGPGSFSVEGIYIPTERKTILPGEKSRWMPRDTYQSRSIGTSFGAGTVLLPTNMDYYYANALELDHALSNNFGVRVKGKFSGLDLSLIGFQGAASAPVVGLHEITATVQSYTPLVLSVAPHVILQSTSYKVQVVGASFVAVLDDFLLKGESAFSRPVSKRYDLPNQGFDHVLALEHGFDFGKDTLTAIVEGTYAYHHDPVENGTTSLARMFDRAGIVALRYSMPESFTFLASYLRDTKYKGNFFHGEVNYPVQDGLSVNLSGDALGGDVGTPLGTYRKNDRLILGLDYHI